MPLPTLPTTEEIRDRIVADIESKINQNTPLLAKAFNRVLATALAFVFTLVYKYGQWAYKQIFTSTQDAESLTLKGEQYGIPRKDANATVVTCSFTGTDGVTVPLGTRYRADVNGLVYVTLAAFQIASGVATTDLKCLTSGTDGNLLAGDTLTILAPMTGLDNQATTTATVTEGEDQETIEQYRPRISEREKRPPQGGALVDYIFWAKEVPGVTRAFAWGKREVPSITTGYVVVYPLTDTDVAGRIPAPAKLTEIHDYIDDPTRAPTQVPVIDVLAMTERVFDITVSAMSTNTAEIRNEFTANITAFLLEREPRQFLDQLETKNVISRSYVETIAIQSGADSITLELFIDGTALAIEDHTLLYYEICKIGVLTFP